MILLLNGSGQTGNRLRSLSSLVALGLETGQDVICPVVKKTVLENLRLHKKGKIKINFFYSRIFDYLSRIISKLCKKTKKNIRINKKINIFTDWISFANPELCNKHYDKIKEYFDFKDEFKKKCEKLLPTKSTGDLCLIAVHLRMGDYKEWKDGKYYYSISTFVNQMNSLYNEKPNSHFVVFSNEIIDKTIFENVPYGVTFMNGTAQEDLCCMSLCDYIIGPPSTYSAWAGYIGNKELIWMKEDDVIYKFSDFQNVVESMKETKIFWLVN